MTVTRVDERLSRRPLVTCAAARELQERDPGAASESWAALDRRLTDQAPWVFLYTPYRAHLVSNRVGNYQHHPFWETFFAQLWVR